MKAEKNSLNLTVVGDWNRFYTDPVWISENLFEKNDKDSIIEMIKQPDKLVLRCKHHGVTIVPSQERMVIICEDFKKESLAYFIKITNSFFRKVPSPQLLAYGFNLSFHEEEDDHFAELIDGILSKTTLSENNIRLNGNSLTFIFDMDGNRFELKLNPDGNQTQITINNEYKVIDNSDTIEIRDDFTEYFFSQSNKLIKAFGYEMEANDV